LTIEKQFADSCAHVRALAAKYRLRTQRENCGTREFPLLGMSIPGRRGDSHIYYYGRWPGETTNNTMAVMFMPDPHGKHPPGKRWGYHQAAMIEAGFTIAMDCDGEGVGRFDPSNESQVRLALKIAGVFPRRQLSPETRQANIERLAALKVPENVRVERQLELQNAAMESD